MKPDSDCSFPCSGDANQTCGGASRVAVYKDPTFSDVSPGATTGYNSKGCYSEGTYGRAVAARQTNLDYNSMTIETCLAACKSQGYSRKAPLPNSLWFYLMTAGQFALSNGLANAIVTLVSVKGPCQRIQPTVTPHATAIRVKCAAVPAFSSFWSVLS